jgi:hypothetical protein
MPTTPIITVADGTQHTHQLELNKYNNTPILGDQIFISILYMHIMRSLHLNECSMPDKFWGLFAQIIQWYFRIKSL